MKLAVILGLLAVALASQHWEQRPELIKERSFHAGKHYSFKFDGQISVGFPQPSSQLSLTRVQSIVSLVFENDRTCLLKLQKTRMGSAHREVSEPRELQPFGLFEEAEMNSEQKEQLSLPIRFRYEQGIISDIEFDREEQAWSANIKRAVLNMLQVNIGKQMRTNEKEIERLTRSEPTTEESTSDFFTTQEKTLEGDCETAYTVVPMGENRLRVSKSINFEKCIRRVDVRYNMRFGDECPSCEKKYNGEEKNTESATVFKFELNYENTPTEFLIREAEVMSQYVNSPLSKEHTISSTFVANKLTLIKITEDKEAVSEPKQTGEKESLIYSTEWEERLERFRMTGDESLIRETPYTWMTKKIEMASRLVKQLRKELFSERQEERESQEYTPEMNRLLSQLVSVMRVCTKKEMHQIFRECEDKESRMSHIFFDACAIAGTKTSIEFLTEKIIQREMSPLNAARLVKMLTNVRNPSEEIIDQLVTLAKENICESSPVLKQSTWLTIGALLNGLCAEQGDRFAIENSAIFDRKESKPMCRREIKEKYVQLLERLYEQAETRYEKVLALKTMANAGFDLIVFPLEKLIRDERIERTIRIKAIDALRQLRTVMPRKVQSILMPVYKNIREYPEIRIAAFHQIMHTIPERVVIDQIVAQLNKEPSSQVSSFVYSALQQYTKSDIPCERDLSRDIEQSLRMTRVQPRKYYDSAFLRATYYNEQLFSGAALNWGALFSNDSVLPKELTASLDTVFGGSWYKYFAQMGIYQQNVDQWLFRLVEKLENNEMESYSMDDVIVRGKRSALPKASEALKKLITKMGITHRRPSMQNKDKEAHAFLYLRYKDLDFAVLPLEEQTIEQLSKQVIRGGKLHLGEMERVLAQGYNFEMNAATFGYEIVRIIPTTLGMPLEHCVKMPTVLTVEGNIKAELEPKSSSSLHGARVQLRAHPKLASTHVITMEVRSPILSNGVVMLHSAVVALPIDAELQMNWSRKLDVQLIVRAPENKEQEKQILTISSRPVTYIRYESEPKKCESSYEKTVFLPHSEEHTLSRVEVDNVYGEQLLGVRFNVRGNIHRHLLQKIPSRSYPINVFVPALTGENHVEITMQKSDDGPREYVIRMNVDALEKESSISERPEEFERFYQKDNEEHFEVEDSEYMSEKEKDRRTEFGSYVKSWKSDKRPAYKGRMHVKVEAVGGRTEKRAQMEIKALCDESLSFCSWKVDARRSPLLEEERKDWELIASLQTLFPRSVSSFEELKQQKHREINAIVNAKWGAEKKNSLNVRMQMSQDKQQQKWQLLTLQKEQMEDNYERLVLASRLNQIKIIAEYNIHPETLVHICRVNSLIKAWKPLSVEIQPLALEKKYQPEGRLFVTFTVEPQTWRYANLSVVCPSERVTINDIRLPFRPAFMGIEKRERMPRSVSEFTRKIVNTPMCEVSSSKVNTFDDVVFRAPLTTCYSLLAKDCSEQPQFAILMKKISKNSEEKKLKVISQDRVYEIEMKKNGDFVVNVDGKKINERELTKHNMEKMGENMIFETEDFKIRFNGYNAQIELAEYYKEQQCGLCGHFDGEREGEFRRADNKETEDLEEFHRSFLSRDEECEMEEEKLKKKENYELFSSDLFDSEESSEENLDIFEKKNYYKKNSFRTEDEEKTVEPKKKTLVIEHSSRICFSQKPVNECPQNSYPKEAKDMKMKFSCMERSEPEARRLLRHSRYETVDVKDLPVSFVDTIRVPKTCIVY